jgi:CRISPR-associated protein Cst2
MKRNPPRQNVEEHLVFKDRGRSNFRIFDFTYDDNSKRYTFDLSKEPKYDRDTKKLTLEIGAIREIPCTKKPGTSENGEEIYSVRENGNETAKIYVKELKPSGPYRIKFELTKEKRIQRILEVICAIKNGLYAQSSGEANTIVPLFLIAGAVKVPSPIFHPYIDIRKEDGQWKVIGVGDALNNAWLEKDGGKPVVYIQDCERLKVDSAYREKAKYHEGAGWEQFLKDLGL